MISEVRCGFLPGSSYIISIIFSSLLTSIDNLCPLCFLHILVILCGRHLGFLTRSSTFKKLFLQTLVISKAGISVQITLVAQSAVANRTAWRLHNVCHFSRGSAVTGGELRSPIIHPERACGSRPSRATIVSAQGSKVKLRPPHPALASSRMRPIHTWNSDLLPLTAPTPRLIWTPHPASDPAPHGYHARTTDPTDACREELLQGDGPPPSVGAPLASVGPCQRTQQALTSQGENVDLKDVKNKSQQSPRLWADTARARVFSIIINKTLHLRVVHQAGAVPGAYSGLEPASSSKLPLRPQLRGWRLRKAPTEPR
jgi:hypothetical protein